jgi:hypothetical protein
VATFTSSLPGDGLKHQLGVQWRHSGRILEGETSLVTPLTPQPTPGPVRSPRKQTIDRRWLFGGAGLIVILLIAAVAAQARRRRTARAAVSPVPFVSAPMPSPPWEDRHVPTTPMADALPGPRPDRVGPSALPPSRRHTVIRHEASQPALGQPAVFLAGEDGKAAGSRFAVEKDPFWIGADPGNDLSFEGDEFLSSHHACIRFSEGTLLVYDNHSTNGTFVNGERLTDLPRPLGLGDRLRVGHSTFVVLAP